MRPRRGAGRPRGSTSVERRRASSTDAVRLAPVRYAASAVFKSRSTWSTTSRPRSGSADRMPAPRVRSARRPRASRAGATCASPAASEVGSASSHAPASHQCAASSTAAWPGSVGAELGMGGERGGEPPVQPRPVRRAGSRRRPPRCCSACRKRKRRRSSTVEDASVDGLRECRGRVRLVELRAGDEQAVVDGHAADAVTTTRCRAGGVRPSTRSMTTLRSAGGSELRRGLR